jgi:hypothetical protein
MSELPLDVLSIIKVFAPLFSNPLCQDNCRL